MRPLPLSQTRMFLWSPHFSTHRPWGRSNCPSFFPFTPILYRRIPEQLKIFKQSLYVSDTMNIFWWKIQPVGWSSLVEPKLNTGVPSVVKTWILFSTQSATATRPWLSIQRLTGLWRLSFPKVFTNLPVCTLNCWMRWFRKSATKSSS